VLIAQTPPRGQSELVVQAGSPPHDVSPLTQKPVPSVMLAQTQGDPGPQGPKVEQVLPVQVLDEQAPLVQVLPAGHTLPQAPQLESEEVKSSQELPHSASPAGQADAVAVAVTVMVVVVTGVAAVVVMAVTPQQEQALL
jgi:hypothetical protein